jgi:hypothetical protein
MAVEAYVLVGPDGRAIYPRRAMVPANERNVFILVYTGELRRLDSRGAINVAQVGLDCWQEGASVPGGSVLGESSLRTLSRFL